MIEIKLTPRTPQLIEGALEIRVIEDSRTTAILRQPDIAFAGGPRVMRMLLPPSATAAEAFTKKITAQFVTARDRFDIGETSWTSLRSTNATFVLGVVRRPERLDPENQRLWQNLRIERFAPENEANNTFFPFSTAPLILAPADFPADPLAACAFDAVLFEPGTFGELKEKAVAALGAWLAAGGSVCLAGNEPLDPAHAAALMKWLASDPAKPALALGPDGTFEPMPDGILRARIGLGRLAVVESTAAPDKEIIPPEWRSAAAFLWKFRALLAASIVETGDWRTDEQTGSRIVTRGFAQQARANPADELTRSILPDTVRVMPLSVVITILVAFIVVVGPLDFFVLGRLKTRRFTWILFPAVSVAFTLLTMKLAAHYLGVNTHRGIFTLTDIGLDGRVVRQTRCEVVLPAGSSIDTRELAHAIEVPADGSGGDRTPAAARYEGQFPARFRLDYPLTQWTPQLFRRTTLGELPDDSGIPWDDARKIARDGFTKELEEFSRRHDCGAILFRRGNQIAKGDLPLAFEFWTLITLAPQFAPFTHISQLSPTADAAFRDLPIMEPGDPDHAVFIAIRREGSDVHAWRRLFPVPESKTP